MARLNRRGRGEIHGMTDTSTYKPWTDMKRRCDDPKRKQFKDYGGRGISYDDSWEYFSSFFSDMGIKPEGFELDRIDNNGNYNKANCRYVELIVNAQNKDHSVFLRGTYKHSRDNGVFVSQIKVNGKMYYLGSFMSEESAHEAYRIMFKEWYGFETCRYKEKKR